MDLFRVAFVIWIQFAGAVRVNRAPLKSSLQREQGGTQDVALLNKTVLRASLSEVFPSDPILLSSWTAVVKEMVNVPEDVDTKPKLPSTAIGAFIEAFMLMTIAEMFDRTWFVAMLCSLKHGAKNAFLGSYTALSVHTFIAAFIGTAAAHLIPHWAMQMVSAAIFTVFTSMYLHAACQADANEDGLKSRMQEARDFEGESGAVTTTSRAAPVSNWKKPLNCHSLAVVFVAMFCAEWGDRTQLTLVTLVGTMPPVPVILGSLTSLIVLCSTAVVVSFFLDGRSLSERYINAACAISFGLIAVLTIVDAVQEFQKHSAK